MKVKLENMTVAYTHAGNFHADDVFSAALLRLINPAIKFIRVNRVPENIENAMVFDIGGGEFDHHQLDSPVRDNGIPYAAFGLLWKNFGHLLVNEDAVQRIDDSFVSRIDSVDNGIGSDNLSTAVALMNPLWNEEQDYDSAFENAVHFAVTILKRLILKENAKQEALDEVTEALQKSTDGIVILNRFAPYEELLVPTETVFVIYPSNRGGYNIAAVPSELNSRENKISFPKEWCQVSDDKLSELTGITSLRFCHKNGFLAATETMDDAIQAAKTAIFIKEKTNANQTEYL